MTEQVNTRDKKVNTVLLLIILLLLGGMGYMSFLWSKKNSELTTCSNENKKLQADTALINDMMSGYVDNMSSDLKQDFKNMLDTYDALIAKDKSKADSLNIQKQKIQSLINELNSNKRMSAAQIMRLQRDNESLRRILKGYVNKIDSLNTLNLKLTSVLDETNTKLTTTTTERDQYKADAEQSKEQVRKGSRLQAYGFTTVGLRMKLNNVTEETNKANKVVQIKSSFTISDNPLTSSGRKIVYMQIMNPDGKIMQSRSSYVVQTEIGSVAYSDKKEIDYQNQRIDLSIFYDLKGEEAVKGNYKVKIFCDGNVIGTDSFTLK
jgi:hypothetical protein